MDDNSADDELIGSELSSEDDFKVGDVNALWKKKKKKKIETSSFLMQTFMFHFGIFLPIYNFCSLLRDMNVHVLLF